MKLIIGMIMIASLAIAVPAQTAQGQAAAAADAAKVLAKYTAMNPGAMKNSPFTADEVNESIQVLADGNRIVRSSTGKMYRNSDGRVRRDLKGGTGGLLGSTFSFSDRTAFNFDFGQSYFFEVPPVPLMPALPPMPAMPPMPPLKIVTPDSPSQSVTIERAGRDVEKVRTELRAIERTPMPAMTALSGTHVISPSGFMSPGGCPVTGANSKSQCRTEQLGNQNIEGVDAEGTRTITTIEAGAIGNDRPIEIFYERWFSKELGVVVASKRNDPRFGEQTYRLTNIVRTEPDPSLFTMPHKVSGGAYRTTQRTAATKAEVVRPTQSTSRAKP